MAGAGMTRVVLPATAADPGAGVRDTALGAARPASWSPQPQPAAGQRLQGLSRRRRADRAARGRRDRRGTDRRSRGRSPTCREAIAVATRSTTTRARRLPRRRHVDCRCSPRCRTRYRHRLHATARGRRRGPARGFARAGFTAPYVVAEQAEPDPDFPTVSFPNPEEPGAIDLALALAAPYRTPTSSSPTTRTPTGAPSPCPPAVTASGGCCAATRSVCCSAMHLIARGRFRARVRAARSCRPRCCRAIAPRHGLAYAETLTGFKWIVRAHAGSRLRLRGGAGLLRRHRCCPRQGRHHRRAARRRAGGDARAAGSSLVVRLDEIAVEYGLHATDQLSVRVSDLALIGAAVDRLRAAPPSTLGGRRSLQSRTCRSALVACHRPTGCATGSTALRAAAGRGESSCGQVARNPS